MGKMKNIFVIAGARPNFIKISPLMKELRKHRGINSILINTGQHYDFVMSRLFFKELEIPDPDYELHIGPGTYAEQTARIMLEFEKKCVEKAPSFIIVVGDVTSTLACSLVGVKLGIPIAHVEAGLRSYNKFMPEETNRIITDHCSALLFCPTMNAVNNLVKEGFINVLDNGKLIKENFDFAGYKTDCNNPVVCNIGDIMYDVLLSTKDGLMENHAVLDALDIFRESYCILTIHRAENTEDPYFVGKLLSFVKKYSGSKSVVFPVHPRTKKIMEDVSGAFLNNIKLIEPVGYFDMLALISNAHMVFTDSGGIQKEAYWLGVPCVTLREETEWKETVDSGWNVLYRNYRGTHAPESNNTSAYGDGKAAERITNIILGAML